MNPKIENLLNMALHHIEADGRPIPHNRWQGVLSKTVRSLVSAPHQSDWMEWEYGTWIGSFAAYDEVGRQLGEANVIPNYLAQPLDDKWRPFKGPGSRKGHPFNVDAFREMSQCWDDLLTDTQILRNFYCDRYQQPQQQPLSARDLYIITSVAVSMPAFLLRRGNNTVKDGVLDRRAAAAFKVLGGMYAATNRMLSQAHPMLIQTELNIDEFLQYIEDEGLLLAPEARACAAPVKMIRQILSRALYDDSDIEDEVSNTSVPLNLSHLETALAPAFSYGTLCVRIDLMVLLYWQGLKYYLKPLLQHSKALVEMQAILQQEYELAINDDIPLSDYHAVVEHILTPLSSTDAEYDFITALPLTNEEIIPTDIALIGERCYHLELAMRVFVRQHQVKLDKVLQRPALTLADNTWSPAPASQFLSELFSMDKRLIKNIKHLL